MVLAIDGVSSRFMPGRASAARARRAGGVVGTSRRRLVVASTLVTALLMVCAFEVDVRSAAPAGAAPLGLVSNFTGTGISTPSEIAAGPDGNLWFTDYGNDSIGRVTPEGVVSTFTGTGIKTPGGIAVGSDGNLWFTNQGNDSIGRITPAGAVSNFTGTGISAPTDIAAGPDGSLWFTNQGNDSIGRITPAGAVSNFTDLSISFPIDIVAGPDGAMWFTNSGNDSIGRITTTGSVLTPVTAASIKAPSEIVADPDGAMWFTNSGNDSIGRVTADGVGLVSNFTGTGIKAPGGITAGPDGAMWFTNVGNGSIGSVGTGLVVGPGAGFHAVTPVRVLDSRSSTGGWASTPLGADQTRDLVVAGVNGVPVTATAVVMNVTVTGGTKGSFLQAFPSGVLPRPVTANLLFGPGQTVPNLVTVGVGAAGSVAFYNQKGSVHVVADVVGYFAPGLSGGRFHSVTPTRTLDSRQNIGSPWNGTPLSGARTLAVAGTTNVPAGAIGIVANVTATAGTTASYLSVSPTPGQIPAPTANLLFGRNQTVPNSVVVGLGTGGSVDLYDQLGTVHVIVDTTGYFAPF